MNAMELLIDKSNLMMPMLSADKTAAMQQMAARLTGENYDTHILAISETFAAEAAAHINAAQRPVIVAGYTAVLALAGGALSRLAEDIRIPVIYTDKAKGVIPCDHRYAVCTLGASEECQQLIDSADFILALDTQEQLWELRASCPILYLASVDEPQTCTLSDALCRIRSLCREKSVPNSAMHTGEELFRREMAFGRDLSFPMCPEKVLFDIRYALALDDILVTDAGAAESWVMGYYDCYQPDTCLFTRSAGTAVMGAVSAKLAKPDHHVLAITDETGLSRSDFEYMQQLHAPVVVLALHAPEQKLCADVADLGVAVTSIRSAAQLIPALQFALRSERPCVIDCPAQI